MLSNGLSRFFLSSGVLCLSKTRDSSAGNFTVLFPYLHYIKSLLYMGVAMFTGGQCCQKCLFGCTYHGWLNRGLGTRSACLIPDFILCGAWTVISSLLVPADPGHGTSTSGWICFSNLYMSLMCYSLYDAVIVRACSSRMEGSQRLVVVLLVVFSFLLCLVSCCV